MGTEVLLPRDLFADRFRGPSFNRRRNFPANGNLTNVVVNRRPHNNNNNHHNKKTSPKKRSVDAKKPNKKDDVTTTTTAGTGSTPMGKVTLLRRGESLDSLTSKIKGANPKPKSPIRKPIDDLAVTGTGRIGPESPEMVPKQIRHVKVKSQPADVYAGSAFFTSPSPKSVPLPSFFSKKIEIEKPFDDSATRDLRRLLRLE
ncbi:proline-rich nuclear receptor coactivator motif-containing protein [Acinetobacter baumannii]